MITAYHAKYYAYELTKRCSSDSLEKLAGAVASAQVDLNPHQVDAALFAFHSPLSKGALLADEVGLGKTIEAGLVISQRWAERKRRILIITPLLRRLKPFEQSFARISIAIDDSHGTIFQSKRGSVFQQHAAHRTMSVDRVFTATLFGRAIDGNALAFHARLQNGNERRAIAQHRNWLVDVILKQIADLAGSC